MSSSDSTNPKNIDPESMEALLIRVAESGDRRAFSELFGHFAPRVKGFLISGGATPEAAEDLTQDVMVKVLQKAKLFDYSKASASTWIYAIARNTRIDMIRRESKPELDPNEPLLLPEAAPRSDEECELNERDARIKRALQELPHDQLVVMRLHFYDDEPHAAIAEKLNLPLGTVKSRLRLAFEKVRKELDFE